jgi:hypothetical protein
VPARPPIPSDISHSRRHLLATGASLFPVVTASAASQLLAAPSTAAAGGFTPARTTPKARSVILIFNCGAPSHIDLWDPKPEAPAEIRGPFQPIQTSVPGIEVSELLPGLAQRMHQLSVIRTVHHSHGGHNSGMHWSTVGRPYRIDSTLINPGPADIPCFGTLIGWLAQRNGYSAGVPPYVITPFPHCDSTKYLTPGQFGGCLGSRFDPFVLNADPNSPNFRVPGLRLDQSMDSDRLSSRLDLLKLMERHGNSITAATTAAAEIDVVRSKALGLISAGTASEAFDLSREPESVRDRYGRHSWGQSHLLARRLIEAGTRFVTTVNGPSITWDTHKDNFNQLKNRLVPPMEQAFTALLDDLSDRGLLDQTLVIWMGDFGRTPKINADAGRDHWPQCASAVLAGGGLRTGQVIGESDRTAAYPKNRPIRPADIHATIFHALGYNPGQLTYHQVDGRPMPVSDGDVIGELV